MFLTNGFQAFSDYEPTREDLYISTMYDSRTKPSFNPEGRILISVNSDNWVMDVRATYESRMLTLALIKYFIKRHGNKNTRSSDDVESALLKLSSYGLLIRRLTDVVVQNIKSFNAEFQYSYTLSRLKLKKPDEVIHATIEFLKKIYQTPVKDVDESIFDNIRNVKYIENNFYSHRSRDKDYLMLKTGPNLFLTNVPPTGNNISIIKEVLIIGNDVKLRANIRQEGFNQMFWMTMNSLVKTDLCIRPAVIYEQDNGTHKLLHRPFLFTEKSFGEIRKPVVKAVELLSMMS